MKSNSKLFNIKYEASFESLSKNNHIRIWMSKPLNSKYQKINNFSISHKPKNIYKDNQGNEILYFEFINDKKINIEVNIGIKLWTEKNIVKTNQILALKTFPKSIKRFLKNEKFLEQTRKLKKLTFSIIKDDIYILDKIYSILNFIAENFKYCHPVKPRGVKNLDLDNLSGDCGEAGALFVAMCRILKIPAKNVTGYVIYYDELSSIYEHGWTSIYLHPYGWVDIDPLAGNIKKIFKKYYYNQKNYFLGITQGFNVALKPSIPLNYKTDYWDKVGLPFTKTSTQILQPLIFASKNKIKFKDSIKII